jgi:uncharacterized membrane protein
MTWAEGKAWLGAFALFAVCYVIGARLGYGRFEESMFWFSPLTGFFAATVGLFTERRRKHRRMVPA